MSLPQEIVDIIIDTTDNEHAWRQCALVCRAWTPTSQRLLFHHITIEISSWKSPSDSPTARLVPILKRSPHLADAVNGLCIVLSHAGWDDGSTREQQDLLAPLITTFVCLSRLSLACESYDNFSELGSSLLHSIRSLFDSPHMVHVVLSGWRFSDLFHFASFMETSTKHTSTLELHAIGFELLTAPTDDFIPERGAPCALTHLVINMGYDFAEAWFDVLTPPLSVKRLHLHGDWGDASSILTRFSSDLEELTLEADNFSDFTFSDYISADTGRAFDRLSKLILKLPICDLIHALSLPMFEENQIEILEIHNVSHGELLLSQVPLQDEVDVLLVSERFSRLTTILLCCSYPQSGITASDFEDINETFNRAIGKGVLSLCIEGTGTIYDSTQIRLEALGNL